MFNFTTDMLLESGYTIPSVSRSKITGESYFLSALESVRDINNDYNIAKKELYTALATESATDDFKSIFSKAYETSFPRKQDIAVKESGDSTESFIKYFSDSIKILNTAIGNISGVTTKMGNQIPIIKKESAEIIEACDQASKDCHCPICGTSPCTCKATKENLYKFDTKRGINFSKIDFGSMEKMIIPDDNYLEKYQSLTEEVKEEYSRNKSIICGLDESVDVQRSNFARDVLNSFGSSKRYWINLNKNYMDYCNESVLGLSKHVASIRSEAKTIARSLSEAVDRIEAVKNATMTNRYYYEDGTSCDLDNDQVQNLDVACKAKTDEAISKCNDALMALGAKLDMLNTEFNQCKAVVSQYACGNDQPIVLPNPADNPTPEPVAVPTSPDIDIPTPIQEDPDSGELPPEGLEDEFGGVTSNDDFDYDIDDDRPYSESITSFALDTIIAESQMNNYINSLLGESSDVYITEGVIGAAKNLLNKIMEFLKKIWGKFTNSMNALFENDVKYLEENKNIITGNTPKRVKIESWHNYKLDKINTAKLGDVDRNFVILQSANAAAADTMANNSVVKKCGDAKNGKNETFAEYFKEYENTNFANTVDKFKDYFMGPAITLNANTLSQKQMIAMYDYCYTFKDKTLKVLKDEIDAVNDMYDKANNSLTTLDNLVPSEDENADKKDEAKQAEAPKAEPTEQASGGNPNNAYSTGSGAPGETTNAQVTDHASARLDFDSIYNDYFAEGMKITGNAAPNTTADKDSPTKNALNTQGTDAQQKNVEKSNSSDSTNYIKDKISKDTISTIRNYYDNVFGMTRDFVSTRLTVAESAYRDYMKLFRWHVGEYKGTKNGQDSSGDVVQPTNNGGNENKEEDKHIDSGEGK
jgi:hypothetical protein